MWLLLDAFRYPGSAARLEEFKRRFPQAEALGRPVPSAGQPEGHVPAEPWLLVTGAMASFAAATLQPPTQHR